jgi:hypothetical protein
MWPCPHHCCLDGSGNMCVWITRRHGCERRSGGHLFRSKSQIAFLNRIPSRLRLVLRCSGRACDAPDCSPAFCASRKWALPVSRLSSRAGRAYGRGWASNIVLRSAVREESLANSVTFDTEKLASADLGFNDIVEEQRIALLPVVASLDRKRLGDEFLSSIVAFFLPHASIPIRSQWRRALRLSQAVRVRCLLYAAHWGVIRTIVARLRDRPKR